VVKKFQIFFPQKIGDVFRRSGILWLDILFKYYFSHFGEISHPKKMLVVNIQKMF
jgi:hypothetical protein